MTYNPLKHHRHSIRLKGYDYSRAGVYFVTICTQHRKNMFGTIVNGEMRLNDAGEMIVRWYKELQNKFPDIECDEFQCMPNHIHFIIINTGAPRITETAVATETAVGVDLRVHPSTHNLQRVDNKIIGNTILGEHSGSSLYHVMQWFKTMSTNEYIRGVKKFGWTRFDRRLFQRDYWEHIVRTEPELNRIRHYIVNNPGKWDADKLRKQDVNSKDNNVKVCEPMAEYDEEDWMV